jgi:hypothetical protein
MGLLESDRMLDATARIARCIATLFNPVLYPGVRKHLQITQEELGLLSGVSRQVANKGLQQLEAEGLLKVEYGGISVLKLEDLRRYGA